MAYPANFTKCFGQILRCLYNVLSIVVYTKGEMSISLRQCIISCLPKGDKSRELLKNWRPISLLSVVYKLASSAIANRIKPLLNKLISSTQTGFVPGRFIGDSTRLVYDIMKYTELKRYSWIIDVDRF